MSMKYEVFIVNVSRKSTQIQLPIWSGVLVNALRMHGIEPYVIDLVPMDANNREKLFRERIPAKPAIIGFNIMAGNDHINQVELFAKIARDKNPDHVIIYGGALPSSMPVLLMDNCLCDYIISGEGERSFPAFIRSINEGNFYPEDIGGLYYKKNGSIVGTKQDRMIVGQKIHRTYQLSELSYPDYSLLDIDFYIDYLKETNQSFEIMSSRGCKSNCSFCYKLVRGLGAKGPDAVLDEISEIIYGYDLDRFYFVDENFLELKPIFREFIEKKQHRKLDFTYRGQCRIDAIDEDICEWGQDNGLAVVSMGIESVNQETLNRMKKGIKIREVEKKLEMLRNYNIGISVNFIVGFPWDTEDDYIEMINFIKRNGLERLGKVSYLTPSPGTKLWYECVEQGHIKDQYKFIKSLGNLFFERTVNFTNLPDDVIDYYYQKIAKLIQRPVTYPKSQKYLEKLSSLF